MYTLDSRIKDILKNPIGKDLIERLLNESGHQKFNKLFGLGPIGAVKLKRLTRLSFVDDDLLMTFLNILNHDHDAVLTKSTGKITKKWWKESICYQIYPKSFLDANGDGIGDIQGIISKLDYLKTLGVDIIWISPIYDSPNADNGYDIRNYHKIGKEYGSMDDFDQLVSEVHNRGMKIIMDLVINHTSDENEWFKLSRLEDETYKDYYIWRDEPNNWDSLFGSSAWTYDESRDQYYLHLFSEKQPDLNWSNAKVREAIYDMVNWWLEKGIDGFRLDVINFISKAEGLPNGNELLGKFTTVKGLEHYIYGPHIHDYLSELYERTFAHFDVMTVGECPGVGYEMTKRLTHESQNELNMIFNFDHVLVDHQNKWTLRPYDLNELKQILFKYQTLGSGCWNTLFFNNHDQPRFISRIHKDKKYAEPLAKMLATILFTLRGTPFIYQGDEIGMDNPEFTHLSQFRDVESLQYIQKQYDLNVTEEDILNQLNEGSRDNSRVPVSWSGKRNANFTQGQPWIRNHEDYQRVNVENQQNSQGSVYQYYKSMINMRKSSECLIYGRFIPKKPRMKDVMAYRRVLNGEDYFIIINLKDTSREIPFVLNNYQMIQSTYDDSHVLFKPYEARIYKRKNKRMT